MTQADLFRWLIESTLAGSAAITVVLLLRAQLRTAFGANAAYLLWVALPLSVLAASLPVPVMPVLPSQIAVGAATMVLGVHAGTSAASVALVPWLLAAWSVGTVVSMLWQAAMQRRFHRSLGLLRADSDGCMRSEHSSGLPAVVGLRARIVLPGDFDARYNPDERALILAHERIHRARGDVAGNVLMTALCCMYWFNPLLWVAADRFRRDQELACDETVIARHPHARRAYGEAMMKTQLSAMPAPLACHWFGGHPLKERIAMLKHPLPGARRMIVGLVLAGCVIAGTACAAWAARPASRVVADSAGSATPAAVDAAAAAAESQAAQAADIAAKVDLQSKMMAPPKYPADAAANRVSGKVVMIIDVAADGSVADARVERSQPTGVFDQVTLDAVKSWRFEPTMKDGKPVAGQVRVPVTFEMDRDEKKDANTAGGSA
ncbi:MAG: TonB family protein [Luteimonas sp.]